MQLKATFISASRMHGLMYRPRVTPAPLNAAGTSPKNRNDLLSVKVATKKSSISILHLKYPNESD